VRLGGLSGLASQRDGHELLAVADDRNHPRVFKLSVFARANQFRVNVAGIIHLQPSPAAPAKFDLEGIAVTRDGHLLLTTEGEGDEEPRLPPAILEYSRHGTFVRQLPVRPRYSPTERGALTSGVRDNAGFEALAMTPDYSTLYTATELPLIQDADADAFAAGSRSRLLEYVASGGSYEPRREFAYDIEPVERPAYDVRPGTNGIVELLAFAPGTLLALERAFVESTDRKQSLTRIRLFRVDLAGATDVSSRESLRGSADVIPVRKTLVVDVNTLSGLAPPLTQLDNFEGMTWGPRGADGRRSLILVSDDNFSERQVTGFLLLRPGRGLRP
jgi:hypothetical protein